MIIMERAAASLEDILTECDLPTSAVCKLATDIALGMNYLHSFGIAHKDLHLGNVLIFPGWRAKVTDFGESALLGMRPLVTH